MPPRVPGFARRLLVVLAAALLSLSAAAADSGPVVVGAPLPLTGRFADFGLMMRQSMEMAAETVNQTGGINGRPLELLLADDRGDSWRAAGVIAELADAGGAVMLVGGYQSDVTFSLARVADSRNLPFLVSTAATDRLTRQRWRNVYRLNPPVSEYGAGLEDFFLKELHPRSVAIVFEDSMFGTDAASNMMGFLQENGIEVRDLITYSAERAEITYLRGLLAPLTRDPPDVIHMISYLEDAVALLEAARELRLSSQLSGGAAGFSHPELLRRAGPAAEGLLVATLWSGGLPYPGARDFEEAYLRRYGVSPSYHGAEAYAAVMVAADALRRAAGFSAGDIRTALDRTFLRTPFGPVRFYDYEGFERQNSLPTQVLQVQDQAFQVIWPPALASARFDPGR